jgi:hypothetical protein
LSAYMALWTPEDARVDKGATLNISILYTSLAAATSFFFFFSCGACLLFQAWLLIIDLFDKWVLIMLRMLVCGLCGELTKSTGRTRQTGLI